LPGRTQVYSCTVIFPKEGQMRVAGQASRPNKLAIPLAADHRHKLFLDLAWYVTKLALRVTWSSFGYTTVYTKKGID
jgi:hypothetical protein